MDPGNSAGARVTLIAVERSVAGVRERGVERLGLRYRDGAFRVDAKGLRSCTVEECLWNECL